MPRVPTVRTADVARDVKALQAEGKGVTASSFDRAKSRSYPGPRQKAAPTLSYPTSTLGGAERLALVRVRGLNRLKKRLKDGREVTHW